jgi:chaperonin GroEL
LRHKSRRTSQSEREYLKLKLDDAVLAVKYAMQDGVVRGGGMALKEIAEKLEQNILSDIIVAPYNQIQENAGGIEIGKEVIDPVRVTISALTNACSIGGIVITSEIAINDKYEKPKIE